MFSGYVSENTTLTPDREYLVTDNVIVDGDAILTIEPGTTLKFSDGKQMTFTENSRLICIGTKENRINLTIEGTGGWNGIKIQSQPPSGSIEDFPWSTISFTNFTGLGMDASGILNDSKWYLFEDNLLENNFIRYSTVGSGGNYGIVRRVNIYDNTSSYNTFISDNLLFTSSERI